MIGNRPKSVWGRGAAIAMAVALARLAGADEHPVAWVDQVPAFEAADACHPLAELFAYLTNPRAVKQPAWKRALVQLGLNRRPRRARVTSYCPHCGGGGRTRWGSEVRPGIIAADGAYWGPGSVVWIGSPIGGIFTVEDTGANVKGRDHFDACVASDHSICEEIGVRTGVVYVELYRSRPRTHWGRRPNDWEPPLAFESAPIVPRVPGR